MILRKMNKDASFYIRYGLVCLLLGLGGVALGGAYSENSILSLILPPGRMLNFLSGFFVGLSAVLLGVSIVLNCVGLRKRRKENAMN